MAFSVGPQLLGLWDLAHFFRSLAVQHEIALGPKSSALDYGAGPTVLSRLFAFVSETRVVAAVQDGFLPLLRALPPLPNWISSPKVDVVPIGGKLFESSDQFDFIFSYACFHEFSEPASVLRRLHRLLNPNGLAVIIDTLHDAHVALTNGLSDSAISPTVREAIRETFEVSLGMEEVSALQFAVPFQISIDILDIPEDVYLDSRLSWQGDHITDCLSDVPASCFCITFKRAA
jgi:SAM-dependent methyltransferase